MVAVAFLLVAMLALSVRVVVVVSVRVVVMVTVGSVSMAIVSVTMSMMAVAGSEEPVSSVVIGDICEGSVLNVSSK